MRRKSHRHGGAVHARGISSLKACVICGANDAGDGLCRVAGCVLSTRREQNAHQFLSRLLTPLDHDF